MFILSFTASNILFVYLLFKSIVNDVSFNLHVYTLQLLYTEIQPFSVSVLAVKFVTLFQAERKVKAGRLAIREIRKNLLKTAKLYVYHTGELSRHCNRYDIYYTWKPISIWICLIVNDPFSTNEMHCRTKEISCEKQNKRHWLLTTGLL